MQPGPDAGTAAGEARGGKAWRAGQRVGRIVRRARRDAFENGAAEREDGASALRVELVLVAPRYERPGFRGKADEDGRLTDEQVEMIVGFLSDMDFDPVVKAAD